LPTNLRGAHQREDQVGTSGPKPKERSALAKLTRKRERLAVFP